MHSFNDGKVAKNAIFPTKAGGPTSRSSQITQWTWLIMSQSLNKCMDNVINIYWSIMLPLFLPVLQVTFGILLPSLARYHRWTSSLMLVCLRDWIGRPLPWIAWVADHCHIWWNFFVGALRISLFRTNGLTLSLYVTSSSIHHKEAHLLSFESQHRLVRRYLKM